MSDNCLFCKIIKKEIPAYVIYEDDHALAFLDITPRTPGHTLVIPKYHAANVIDLPNIHVAPLFLAVKATDKLLTKSFSPEGLTIGVNQGAASGQEVDHLHVHLMPRWHDDGGTAIQGVVKNIPKESVEEIYKKITGK